MSRYYASIQESRGMVTKQGQKMIEGHIRGWNIGVRVTCFPGKDGEDVCNVVLTNGSNGTHPGRHIGSFTEKDLLEMKLPSRKEN